MTEGRCWFDAMMTGLALERGVDNRLRWTVDLRLASSDTGRTLISSSDGLV